MAGRIVIGTASWADPGFVEEWYPPDLPPRDRLPYYAERFEGVEVNSTFYAIPAVKTVAIWLRQRFWLSERRIERTLGWLEEHGAAFVSVDGPQGSNAPTVMPAIDA